MNDTEFQELQEQIHHHIVELIRLQEIHVRETGRPYEINGPIKEE